MNLTCVHVWVDFCPINDLTVCRICWRYVAFAHVRFSFEHKPKNQPQMLCMRSAAASAVSECVSVCVVLFNLNMRERILIYTQQSHSSANVKLLYKMSMIHIRKFH